MVGCEGDQDAYVQETQSSDDDHPDVDDEAMGRNFFFSRTYTYRADIAMAVVDYNLAQSRAFRVKSSDHRRYKAVCAEKDCSFVVAFAYGSSFEPPTMFHPHTCDPTGVDLTSFGASRVKKASYLAELPLVRQFVIDNGCEASPAELQRLLVSAGRDVTYLNCIDVCRSLKEKLYKEARQQFKYVSSYVHAMEKRGHKADIEVTDNMIRRVVIVYKQGIQVMRVFANRGVNLDGTFVKHEHGGALLVACLRYGNNKIQVVAVA